MHGLSIGIEPDVIEGGAGAKNSVRKDEILVPRWSVEHAAWTWPRRMFACFLPTSSIFMDAYFSVRPPYFPENFRKKYFFSNVVCFYLQPQFFPLYFLA